MLPLTSSIAEPFSLEEDFALLLELFLSLLELDDDVAFSLLLDFTLLLDGVTLELFGFADELERLSLLGVTDEELGCAILLLDDATLDELAVV